MNDKEQPDRWSDDGSIFWHFGKGWALTPSLRTVCIGTKEEYEKAKNEKESSVA